MMDMDLRYRVLSVAHFRRNLLRLGELSAEQIEGLTKEEAVVFLVVPSEDEIYVLDRMRASSALASQLVALSVALEQGELLKDVRQIISDLSS